MNIPKCKEKKLYPVPIIVPGIKEFEIDEVNSFQRKPHVFAGPLIWKHWGDDKSLNLEPLKNKKIVLIAVGSSFPCEKAIKKIYNTLCLQQILKTP